jgi:hypothetical protein
MNAIQSRFITMLNFCYMIALETDTKKQREYLDKMSAFVKGEK